MKMIVHLQTCQPVKVLNLEISVQNQVVVFFLPYERNTE